MIDLPAILSVSRSTGRSYFRVRGPLFDTAGRVADLENVFMAMMEALKGRA